MRLTTRRCVTRHACCLLAYVLVFQDVTGVLAQTPALSTPRVGHTTAITGDGAAVITGGRPTPGGAPTDSAERYDPTNETVTPVPGPMSSPRAGHASVSTAAGEVLLGGGEDSTGRLATLETFLPVPGHFIPSALALPGPLAHFTATALSESRILVAGGYNGSSLASGLAYLVNPRTHAVVPSKSQLSTPRAKHAAALLPDGRIALIAGETGSGPTAAIELYDPAQDAFTLSPVALATPRSEAAVALLPSGQLLVTGGRGTDGTVRTDSELVELVKGTVTPGPALPGPRAGHTLTLLPDGRLLLAGGSDGTQALTTLDRLPPLAPDTTPPSVVHVSPPDNAHDVPVDSILSLRFSEPVRAATLSPGTVVLSGPTGRVEGTVATAEAGLLAFFTPSLLEADTTYTLALAGITDTSGNALPAFSSRFRTGTSAGEAPRVASFTPTAGSPGDEVTVRGERFTGATGVGFGGVAAASFSLANDTTLKALVPVGAVSGPLSVTTPAGTGTSTGSFVVLSKPDFTIAAAPDRGETVPGDSSVFALTVVPSGGFLGMVTLSVSGLAAQLTASFDKPLLGPLGYAYLTVQAASPMKPGPYSFTVTGTADLAGQMVQRTVTATLQVAPPAGTSLSGHVRRLDGTPVPNAIFRVGTHATRTDGAGNFLLRNVAPAQGRVVFVLDARPANSATLEYPVFEMLMTGVIPGRPNRVNPGPIWLPTMDPRTAVPLDSASDQVARFSHLPGLEVHLPKGTRLQDVDGRPLTRLNAALIPMDRGPFPMPPGLGGPFMVTVQPSGSRADIPFRVILPNYANYPAGSRVPVVAHDPQKGGWFTAGQASVTATQIVPDPDVTFTRFSCIYPPPAAFAQMPPGGATGGEPVDLFSGAFLLTKTDFVLPGRLPLVFTRVYRSGAPADPAAGQRQFGFGASHTLDPQLYQQLGISYELRLATDYRLTFPWSTHVHTATPPFYGAKVQTWPAAAPYGYDVRFQDGTRWGFTGSGYLVGVEDRHGNKLTLERNLGESRIQRILTPDGRQVAFEYEGTSARITRLLGPLDLEVRYEYNAAADLIKVTDPLGGVTEYTVDANHNITAVKDPRGITYLTNTYSPTSKRVLRQTQADSGTWFFRYELTGATTSGTNCPTSPIVETYENAINPGGCTITGGSVVATTVVDPRGKTTRYTFNAAGYHTSVTNHLGQTTTLDREGGTNFVTEVKDHLGRKTVFGYDTCCRNLTGITRYKDPIANPPTYSQPVIWQYTYDTANFNLLTSVTTPPIGNPPAPRTWTYWLDAAGKTVTSITDPLTHQTTMTYNTFGQPTQITDALSHATFLDYDPVTGFLTGVRDHLNNATTYAYDLLGRRELVTDPRGAKTRFTYDQLNRVTAIADPLGGAVRFQYDANSNLTKVIDPRGGEITYTYDNMDQLVTRKDPLLRQETFGYDLAGNLTSFQDRKNQLTTWSAYDNLNRPTTVTFQGGATLTYGYDAANRLETLTDSIAGPITWG
jgi:YD repeat-containing protein